MRSPCANCPFSSSKAGKRQRRALRPGRMAEITRGLRAGATFCCHKTTSAADEDVDEDDESYTPRDGALVCAGALAWSEARGISSNYVRVAERLEGFAAERAAQTDSRAPAILESGGLAGMIEGRWQVAGHFIEVEDLAEDRLARRLWRFRAEIPHNLGMPWTLRLAEFWEQARKTTRHKFVRREGTKGYCADDNRRYWDGAGLPVTDVPLPSAVETAARGELLKLAQSAQVART